MKISYTFKIDSEAIKHVCKIKDMLFNKTKLVILAKKNLDKYSSEFSMYESEVQELLIDIFYQNKIYNKQTIYIDVIVFPSIVPMGAVECSTKKIYLGNNFKIKALNTALIAHETTHILLYRLRMQKKLSRLTEEVIAYLVENEILFRCTKRKYFSVWKLSQLDKYHKESFECAEKVYDEWKLLLKGLMDLNSFLSLIESKLPKGFKYNKKLKSYVS